MIKEAKGEEEEKREKRKEEGKKKKGESNERARGLPGVRLLLFNIVLMQLLLGRT